MRQPQTLAEVVGQPELRPIRHYVQLCHEKPVAKCYLLSGEPGIGKTVAAQALAHELGCDDEETGRWIVNCTELSVESARQLFDHTLRIRWSGKLGMNVLILEEFEWVSPQCQRFLKTALDPHGRLPRNLCVVATSNDTSAICPAVMERFAEIPFQSGKMFERECRQHLAALWINQTQDVLPTWFHQWGKQGDRFSMRVALRCFDEALEAWAANGRELVCA